MNYFDSLSRVLIIAEIGVNHNGDVSLAKQLIDAAIECGADAVKFQTFTAESLALPLTPKVEYQLNTTGHEETHLEMLQSLELGREEHKELVGYCRDRNIDFLSTPYDIQSAEFLATLNIRLFKTASADLVDLPLQRHIASTGIPTMVATGMGTVDEIESVVRIYEEQNNPNLILLHCVSNYPCSDASLNLRAMQNVGIGLATPFGFSDHSEGYLAATASVAMGAKVVEKHFTLDKTLPGPDHNASSDPDEFATLVRNIRRIEKMLGNPRKACQPEERQMAAVSRKSLVLRRSLSVGDKLKIEDLELKRPGTGIGAKSIPQVIGRLACKELKAGLQLGWSDLEGDQ